MGLFDKFNKPQHKTAKKQVILRNQDEVDLYYQVKGKMQSQQKTFSDWLITRMREEIYPNHE